MGKSIEFKTPEEQDMSALKHSSKTGYIVIQFTEEDNGEIGLVVGIRGNKEVVSRTVKNLIEDKL